MSTYTFEKSYSLRGTVSRVYATWVSEQTVVAPAIEMKIDPRVGGHYVIVSAFGDTRWVMNGRFLEVVPEAHLRYSWEWNNDGDVSTVEIAFAAAGDQTEVSVRHSGFASEASFLAHVAGWDRYIEGFQTFVER